MRKRWWLLGAIILLTASVLLYFKQETAIPVRVAQASQADLISTIQTTGKVILPKEWKLYAPADGKLKTVDVTVGENVKSGQIVAQFDKSDIQNKLSELGVKQEMQKLEQAKLEEVPKPEEISELQETIKQEEIHYQAAVRTLQTATTLYDTGAITSEQLKQNQDELHLAESRLNTAKSRLQSIQNRTNKTDLAILHVKSKELELQEKVLKEQLHNVNIVSQDAGTVIHVSAQSGQYVLAGSEIATIADLSQVEIAAEVKEPFIHKLYLGQDAEVSGSAIGSEKIHAKVIRIDPVAHQIGNSQDNKAASLTVYLKPTSTKKLIPGLNLDIDLIDQRAFQIIQVPYDSVYQDASGNHYVWKVINQRAYKTAVQIGMKNEHVIEIKQGLQKGETVILTPPDELDEGKIIEFQ